MKHILCGFGLCFVFLLTGCTGLDMSEHFDDGDYIAESGSYSSIMSVEKDVNGVMTAEYGSFNGCKALYSGESTRDNVRYTITAQAECESGQLKLSIVLPDGTVHDLEDGQNEIAADSGTITIKLVGDQAKNGKITLGPIAVEAVEEPAAA